MTTSSHSEKKISPWIGALLVFAVLIALNVVSTSLRLKLDLTEERLFTLSRGTEGLLGDLPAPVTLKFYYSRGNEVPAPFKQYQQRTIDLLREMERASGGKVVLELYDPQPDSDEEEWAQRYGLAGQSLNPMGSDATLYMGLVAVSGQREAAIPFLAPNGEAQMEYNIARLIYEASRASKPKVGIMSSLPVVGPAGQPAMRGRPGNGGWVAASELRRYYEVVPVNPEAESIPGDVTTLVVVHPKNVSEKTLYAIDQFVMRGGRLVVFEDPLSMVDRDANPDMSGMNMFMGYASDLNRITSVWGATMKAGEVVADASASSQISFGNGHVERLPTWLTLRSGHINAEDALTANIRSVMLPFSGGFEVKEVEGITATPLLTASSGAVLINAFMASSPGPGKLRNAQPAASLPLAVRLHGTFATAFSNGPPVEAGVGDEKTEKTHLTRTEEETMVLLVGDVDLLHDQFAFRAMNILGQTIMELANDNFSLLLSMIEQGTGSDALIGLRSRGVQDRSFTRVLALQQEAEQRWQNEELNLLQKLQEAQQRLSELQVARDDNQQLIISPEQKAEIENFRKVRFDTQRELKQVRRNLRKDIEKLGFQVKAFNLAAVPALVAFYGLLRGWRRRRG